MKKLVIAALFFVCIPALAWGQGCDGSGNCYVRAGAAGTGAGTSWTNACTGFTGSCAAGRLIRGVTYWVAAGTYNVTNFSAAVSGTALITVEGATVSSHGTASDWNNSYVGQATFLGDNLVSTSYWTFNGQGIPGCVYPSNSASCYSLKFWNQTDASGYAVGIAGTHITFQYVELEGTGMTGGAFPNNTTADRCSTDGCGTYTDNAISNQPVNGDDAVDNLYVGYSYAHHTGNTQFQLNTYSHNTATFEYDWVSYNHTGQNGIHDEAFSVYYSNLTIRYNVMQDICGSGIITDAGGNTPAQSNWDVYGNLFFWDAAYAGFNGQYSLATINNGIVDFLGEVMSGYVHFYNNTMAGFYNQVADSSGSAFSTIAVAGLSGYSSGSPTVQIYNNLWYQSAYTTGDYDSYCSVVSGATCVQDYDTFYQGGIPSGDFMNPSESHAQAVTGGMSPFVNSSPSTIAGFGLVAPDPFLLYPGSPLATPYNLDMLGTLRGADGTWDRGAVQILTTTTATPTFNPPGGVYNSPQTVFISDATPGAAVYYTTDGTSPTAASTPSNGPISVIQSMTINAIASSAGLPTSSMVSAVYVLRTATPTFSPPGRTYNSPQSVSISDAGAGAVIYYTTDGTTPTAASTPYTGPISVTQTMTIQAIATSVSLPNSSVASSSYVLQTAKPKFNPPGGVYSNPQSVSISDANAGALIYYTTDGTTPTAASTQYSGPITVIQNTTINAIASSAGLPNSSVASSTYAMQTTMPVFSPPGGTYSSPQSVSISDATPGAVVYYTTDGTTPTVASTPNSGLISVTQNTTINAIASSAGLPTSFVSSSTYTLQTAKPTLSLAGGTYNGPQSVTISDANASAVIYYTTDGTIPTASSTKYNGPISVTQNTTIKSMATAAGWSSSSVASTTYTLRTATPSFSPAGGTYNGPQSVSISDASAGAVIYYTTDGTTPTASSTAYGGPISVTQSMTIKAMAMVAGWSSSAVASTTYTLRTATPSFSPAGGTYNGPQSVSISDMSAGAVIYYTTDGTTPTASSTAYGGPISVTQSMTIKAMATAAGLSSSAVATATYTLQAATPSFSLAGGTYSGNQSVTLADASPGVTIYYTTNGSTPTIYSPKYKGPFQVNQNITINAIAARSGWVTSPVASATYTVR